MNLGETMQCKLFHRVVVPRMCPAPRARDTPRPISQKTSKYAEDGSVGAELRRRVEVRLELQGATHNLGQPRIYVGTSEHSSTPPRRFNAPTSMQKHQASFVPGPPTLFLRWIRES